MSQFKSTGTLEKVGSIETEQVEVAAGRRKSVSQEVEELSGIEATAASKAAWLFAITVSIGNFLFGYDTGYISSVLVTLGTALGHELSSNEAELVTSLTSGGALVGAVGAGLTADRFGRRWPIWGACGLFVIGTVLQTAAFSVPQFAVGRFTVGLGVGSAAMIVPLFIGELAPAKYRGRMISFSNMSVTLGQFIASALGAGFEHAGKNGWRATVGIGGIPACLLAFLLTLCPESPRQLVAHGKVDQAEAVLLRIYPTSSPEQRQAKIKSIQISIEEVNATMHSESLWTSSKRIFSTPSTGRAVTVACITMAISQLSGFNTLMYYAATLFGIVGFRNPTAVGIVVSGTNFIFSIVNLVIVDKLGRRLVLLVTVLAMSLCLLLAAITFHFIPIDHNLVLLTKDVGWPGIVILVTIILFVAFYSTGVATIAWIGTELIPLEVRAVGTMMNTVTCWGTNIIIASTFLSMMKGLTPSGAFGFYAGITFIGWVFIVFCYPEVRGMPLEAIREVFSDGFGIKYSAKWQRDNKHLAKRATNMAFGH